MRSLTGRYSAGPALSRRHSADPSWPTGSNFFLLLVTSGSFLFIGLAGQIYLAESVLGIYVLHRIASLRVLPFSIPNWMLWTLAIWLVGTLSADFTAGADALQSTRGVARILFLGIDLIGLYLLVDKHVRHVSIAWLGMLAASALSFVIQPSTYARALPWKFEFGAPATIALALWIDASESRKRWGVPAFLAITGVHFALGFRSMAVVSLLIAFLLLVRIRPDSPHIGERQIRLRPLLIGFGGSVAAVLLIDQYDRLSIAGVFGKIAQQKAMFQSGGEYGSLLSSRNELFLSLGTIVQKPLFGGGSFSTAEPDIVEATATMYNNWGYTSVATHMLVDIPAYHSTLLGSWAENGILATPFWLAVLGVFCRGLVSVLYRECDKPTLVALLCTSGIWDLFFSPFGAERRMWLALSIITVITLITTKKDLHSNAPDINHHNKLQPTRLSSPMRKQREVSKFRRL